MSSCHHRRSNWQLPKEQVRSEILERVREATFRSGEKARFAKQGPVAIKGNKRRHTLWLEGMKLWTRRFLDDIAPRYMSKAAQSLAELHKLPGDMRDTPWGNIPKTFRPLVRKEFGYEHHQPVAQIRSLIVNDDGELDGEAIFNYVWERSSTIWITAQEKKDLNAKTPWQNAARRPGSSWWTPLRNAGIELLEEDNIKKLIAV